MNRLKKYLKPISLSLAFIVLTLISCSKNDDEISCSTFLECLDGSVWTSYNQQVIYRFNNNLNNPVEKWYNCISLEGQYWYSDEYFDLVSISNRKDEIIVEHEVDNIGIITTTFMLEGNDVIVNENPCLGLSCGGRFSKTTINVDNFSGCN